ncbi:MAG TPA: HPF/RaiA family ribosome-associated protein [Cellvibrionaceae bacterium]
MQVQVNTDHNIEGHEKMTTWVSSHLQDSFKRFGDHITRIEVHLSDKNSNKKGGGDDMRCLMEARLSGMQPIAVTHDADNLDQAVNGATHKLTRAIDSVRGKLNNQHNRKRPTPPDDITPEEE